MQAHIDTFRDSLVAEGLAPLAITTYIHAARSLALDVQRIGDLTLDNVKAHIDRLGDTLSSSSVTTRVAGIKRFLRYLHSTGIVEDMAPRINAPKPPVRMCPKGITKLQVNRLIAACTCARDRALVGVMALAGLRVGEAIGLKLKDVEGPSLHVCAGKGNKARTIPISEALRSLLVPLVAERKDAGAKPCSYLFIGRKDSPHIGSVHAHTIIKAAALHAGIEGVSCHTLRHAFAGIYLKAHPGKLVNLATLMGHANINTTAIYTRPTQEDLANELNAL